MNQDKQPEALRLADDLDASNKFTGNSKSCNTHAAAELRRLHARIAELEAAQAQPVARTPLSDEQIAGFNRYVVGTVHGRFARAKALVRMSEQYHHITQEKQG